ncbi:MAG TPA: tetratricopeptide repeat protein [Anaerolineales bacterium]|nr:tetratricopeptide repeat protein [Anaerolineales bacterium]
MPTREELFGKGLGAYGKGNLDEAIAAIKKAIELDPQEALYHTELSRLYVQLKMVPEAEAATAEAMRLQRSR